jgi:hypothetical protein
MIKNLNEINRILLCLRRFARRRLGVPQELFIKDLKGMVILGQNPEFEPILDFVNRLGIINIRKKHIRMTKLGEEIVTENIAELYDLQPKQGVLLLRKCYLDGPLRPEMKTLIKHLSPDATTGKMVWSSVDSEPFGKIEWLANHLIQLGVLNAHQHLLIVADSYKETISQFLDEGGDYTEKQMEQNLREKRLLADLAETFVVEFEKSRLAGDGHKLESGCVQRISKHRVNAGYDINSFNGASKNLTHDRFIEVKGSGKTTVYFFWSQNEIQKATKLGDKYWIYFVGGIDRKNRAVKREPVMIQNPNIRLQSDPQFQIQPSNMLVEANLYGNLMAVKEITHSKAK